MLVIFTLIKVNIKNVHGEICNNEVNLKNLMFDMTKLSWRNGNIEGILLGTWHGVHSSNRLPYVFLGFLQLFDLGGR